MDWKNKLFQSFWKNGKDKLIFVFCFGLLLFILALPTEKLSEDETGSEAEHKTEKQMIDTMRENADEMEYFDSSYEISLEQRIQDILEGVEGVGAVDVMVWTTVQQENGYSAWDSENSPEVTGVVISADGGGSQRVKTEISQAMEALFGIPSHKIKVLKRVKKESQE